MPWTRTTPKGREITFYTKDPTEEELIQADVDADWAENLPDIDETEDPDSDGYGWERKALRGAWAKD